MKEAVKIILEGGTVIFPTETVYGLGANALNAEAVKKIYALKKDPFLIPSSFIVLRKKRLLNWLKTFPKKLLILRINFGQAL
jgi:L-threonylcarbamoyladenylate synthase